MSQTKQWTRLSEVVALRLSSDSNLATVCVLQLEALVCII